MVNPKLARRNYLVPKFKCACCEATIDSQSELLDSPPPLTTITDREHLCTTLSDTLPRTRPPTPPSPRFPTMTRSAFKWSAAPHIESTGLPDKVCRRILIPAGLYL